MVVAAQAAMPPSLALPTVVLCAVLSQATGALPPVKVLAFNVLYQGEDDVRSLAAIKAEAPDVVCLTEVTPTFVTAFEHELGADYPYRQFVPTKGTWGVGLAARVPIAGAQLVPVAPLKLPMLEARVVLQGKEVLVGCVHLNPPAGKHRKDDTLLVTLEKNAAVRKRQADWLVARYAKLTTPALLLGDFNEERVGAAMKALELAGFANACDAPSSRCGPTFPGPQVPLPPVFTIDHVLGRGVTFTDGAVVRAGGSDHYPVTASLAIRPSAP
jgi:endonuclease/exonuclease/phosphatase (EEP) superfamily protein YafD